MRIRRLWITSLAAATTVLCGSAGPVRAAADPVRAAADPVRAAADPVRAAAVHPVAFWAMDEPAGSRTMHDSSGHGLDGRIGGEVGVGSRYAGAVGYRFARLEPDTPPPHPQHLVVVP